jgi:hypothetical protein
VSRVQEELDGLVRRREQAQVQQVQTADIERQIPEIQRCVTALRDTDAHGWRQLFARMNLRVHLTWVEPSRGWPFPFVTRMEVELLASTDHWTVTPGGREEVGDHADAGCTAG